MIPTLSQVCSLNAEFGNDIEEYAAGQCRSVELWLTKVEDYLKSHSIDDVKQLFVEHGVACPVASFQGGLLTSQGEKRVAAWELFEQRLELCAALGVETLIVVGDVYGTLVQEDIERVRQSLVLLAQSAGRRRIRIAFEFQGKASFGNNLQTAVALVNEVGSPHLGICLDLFQFHLGPSKEMDWELLTSENLFHVQLADLADVPREFATDSDRILPGDGDFSIQPLVDHLKGLGYGGCVAIELMNPLIWQISPRQFGEIAMTALRQQLGIAQME